MIPVVTPSEMAAIDAAAPEGAEVLIERAGAAVAMAAAEMLTGDSGPGSGSLSDPAAIFGAGRGRFRRRRATQRLRGRTVAVLAGAGNNGADGRAAGRYLQRAGATCHVLRPDCAEVPPCDLLIDAAYGTGLNRPWQPPAGAAEAAGQVLAVDIPSGVDGLTGAVRGGALAADRTVTFAALKPGLLLHPGRELAGRVTVADIGLEVGSAEAHLMTDADVAEGWPRRPTDADKWWSACWVVAGSALMPGAASLAAQAALRSGAGYVRLSVPGAGPDASVPTEAVLHPLPRAGWHDFMDPPRFGALVLGPGLGLRGHTLASVRATVTAAKVPLVIDADGLNALRAEAAKFLRGLRAPVVLTPHDREYRRLTGRRPGDDRLAAARRLAADCGAFVLLKGPTTVVAAPDGVARFVASGDARLATAGSGDVLAGMIGALLAQRTAPLEAAALAAHVHGMASRLGPPVGLLAGDLPALIPSALASVLEPPGGGPPEGPQD
ncbi:MAG: NAD(P)H-hydrate dehydratase [bacterium]|nr:NAD(P)H-hydrate dehydratase [bacterium]